MPASSHANKTEAGKLKRVGGKKQLSTHIVDAPKTIARVASLESRVNCLFVHGLVNTPRDILLDTAATMTIIRPELAEKKRILPMKWTFQTATGDSAKVLGETVVNFRMGDFSFEFQVLVAEIQENIIWGLDIMTECGCKLDLRTVILRVCKEELVLNLHVALNKRSETIVPARLEEDVPENQVVILEPIANERQC